MNETCKVKSEENTLKFLCKLNELKSVEPFVYTNWIELLWFLQQKFFSSTNLNCVAFERSVHALFKKKCRIRIRQSQTLTEVMPQTNTFFPPLPSLTNAIHYSKHI